MVDIKNKNPYTSSKKIRRKFKQKTSKNVSKQTVRRNLDDQGIVFRIARRCPKLTEVHKEKNTGYQYISLV